MKVGNSMLKKIILFIVSVGIGSFVTNVLEKTELNVWLSRGVGAIVAVIVAVLLYYLWINKS